MTSIRCLTAAILVACLLCNTAQLACANGQPAAVSPAEQDGGDAEMPGVIVQTGAGFEIHDIQPVMRKVLTGVNAPIRYRAAVEQGGKYTVVFGFFEAHYGRTGQRVMRLDVEGGDAKRLDVLEHAKWKQPFVVSVFGMDTDRDGRLHVTVGAHADAADRNASLAGLWIFDRGDWKARQMTPEKVLDGAFDQYAYHIVDCGDEHSRRTRLSFDRRLQSAMSSLQGLKELAGSTGSNKQVAGATETACAELEEGLGELQHTFVDGRYHQFVSANARFTACLHEARGNAERILAEKYVPTMRKPAQTHLSSPWGALVRVRQEDTLKLNLDILPRPTSLEHKYHPAYAKRDPFGWIKIATSAQARRDSTALGLDYDLGLQGLDYDPLLTHYRYREGNVHVQIMDKAAVRVWSEELTLQVAMDWTGLRREGDLLSGEVQSVHDATIHYALLFKDKTAKALREELSERRVSCDGFTILWADSPAELKSLAAQMADWDASQKVARKWHQEGTKAGRVSGPKKLAERAAIDRRTLLSNVFKFGGAYAALDGSYESIWVRDTAIVAVAAALAGDPQYLKNWAPYVLANPTPVEFEGQSYKTFIIAPYDGQHLFKMEDDGPFYAAWSAYAYWKLLGDDRLLGEWYETLDSAMRFLEAKSYRPELGLYSEALINEAPLKDSPYWQDEKHEAMKIGDDWPMRIHSIYVNNLMYATHLMMGEMCLALNKPAKSRQHFDRADSLVKMIEQRLWDPKANRYWAGIAIMEDGQQIPVDCSYWDIFFDYAWAFGLFPITPNGERSLVSVDALVTPWLGHSPNDGHAHTSIPYGYAAWTLIGGGEYEKAETCLKYVAGVSKRVDFNPRLNAVYAMSGAMFEWNTLVRCHRPQVFAAAPCLNAIVALGAAVDFNGVNVTPSGKLDKVEGLMFKDAILDIDLAPVANLAGLMVDGTEVLHTLRIPSSVLTPGEHEIRFLNQKKKAGQPLLLHTNLELLDVHESPSGEIEYRLRGYGSGVVRFERLKRDAVRITDESGNPLAFEHWSTAHGDCVRIEASGEIIRLFARHFR